MSARLRELVDKRAAAWSQVQDIQERLSRDGYDPATDDEVAYSRSLEEVEKLSQQVETEERAARMAAAVNAPVGDYRATAPQVTPVQGAGDGTDREEAYRRAFTYFMRHGMQGASPEDIRALQEGVSEIRAGATSTGAAGGYLVPTTFLTRMNEVRKAFGGIAQFAETITTTEGNTIQWPTNDDTSNTGAILAENSQITEQDVVFGQASIGSYTYTSKLVRLSFQLLQDNAFSLDTWLPRKLGERIGRATAAHFATGTGSSQPQGLVTGLTLGVTSAGSGAIAYDDLVEIEHTIDPAYRNGSERYVVHDSVIKALRKLKDTTGRPLWAPAITVGAPSTINGKPYTVDNGLATLAAGSKSVVYGDIQAAYLVREVAGAQVLRLQERYADYLQVGFFGFQRLDAKVQDTQAAAVLTTKA